MYICSCCRRQGSIAQRLFQYEQQLARANDERLASARLIEEREASIRELRNQNVELVAKHTSLQSDMLKLTQQLMAAQLEPKSPRSVCEKQEMSANQSVSATGNSEGGSTPSGPPSLVDSGSEHSSDNMDELPLSRRRKTRTTDLHPPGFKVLISRINKFSGEKAADNFEVWLEDYVEATGDCGWSHKDRAQWFSWFLTGPAKATWLHSLKTTDKASWESIVKVFKGEYGVHLDPRTAYQRCHELQYEQFGSAQGLVTAMREYQRMAPQKLTDVCLESILWNKAPVELQREVKEITTDGSVHELLQKLLRAEAVIQERARREKAKGNESTTGSGMNQRSNRREMNSSTELTRKPTETRNTPRRMESEMGIKGVKCFICKQKGHMAKSCPEARKNPARMVVLKGTGSTTSDAVEQQPDDVNKPDPWMRTVIARKEKNKETANFRGPSYKVNLVVEGVKTRGFLDHGAQVSLIRKELLPAIKEKQSWTHTECHERDLKMGQQPIGATGASLGAISVVRLQVMVDETGVTKEVPCFVLASEKPIWSGELHNCGVILGTNALVDLGFQVIHSNGTVVHPEGYKVSIDPTQSSGISSPAEAEKDRITHLVPTTPMCEEHKENKSEQTSHPVLMVSLAHAVSIGPQQTSVADVRIQAPLGNLQSSTGIVVPKEDSLASMNCDLVEGIWMGQTDFKVPVTNWGSLPLMLQQGDTIAHVEGATIVTGDDDVWQSVSDATIRAIKSEDLKSRQEELCSQLIFGNKCTKEERESLRQLLCDNQQVFALTDYELGEVDLVEHKLTMKEHQPIRAPPRRLPYALREELESELGKLLDIGCVEPSSSPYSSGLVLVRKKDGGLRVCVDYRGINKDTVPDCFPIPRIDDLIDMVGRCKGKVFTTLDLMKGYHQIRMHSESKEKTAFTCHMGHFQYRRMPFGLTNAPATFQRLMSQLFSGKEWDFVFVYLDDLLIVSKSMSEHLGHLKKVLNRLMEIGLKLKPTKCAFAREQVDYLGHTLSAEGVRPNSAKVEAVKNFPRPKSSKEIKSFLGLINFYRRHLPNFAVIARPLTALTRQDKELKKTVPFVWDDKCEAAFQKAKELLITAPLLYPPDLTRDFFLWTDASGVGFGAVLEQVREDGCCHPVAYASRQTNAAEAKYAPTELEVAALVYAVTHFEVYLLGNSFTAYTDHQALVSAFIPHMKSQVKGLLARWYLKLAPFLPKMKLEFKPGSANTVADALSRAPVPASSQEEGRVMQLSQQVVEPSEALLYQVQRQQKQDPELAGLYSYLKTKMLPEDPQLAKVISNLVRKGYFLIDDVLYYEGPDAPDRRRVVVPQHLRKRIIDENHDTAYAGHFSVKKMTQRIRQYFYWSGMRGDVYKKCAGCVTCASVSGQGIRERPALVSIPVGGPFECIGMDFVEMDRSRDGNRYALVIQDYLTKWPEVYAVQDRKAETVAKCLLDLIWRHGVPSRIIHDRAAEFLAEVLQETASLLGITQLPTSGGHPQTDGLVERFNRTLKQMLAKVVAAGGHNWDSLVGPVLFAYRTTPHTSTGLSPFYLLYGRNPQLPTSLDFSLPVVKYPVVESEYAKELAKELKQARALAQKNIQARQREQKKYYDRRSKIKDLKIGDLVMLKTQSRFRLDRSFKGPFVVQSVTSTNAVIKAKDIEDAEEINVSRQRLSICSDEMKHSTPWIGHGNRLRKRRRIRKRKPPCEQQASACEEQEETPPPKTVTRSGRQVNKPSRYRSVTVPESSQEKREEVVRTGEITKESRPRVDT